MTPVNIAAMSALAGYDVIALSDHNMTKNCRAMAVACAENGLLFIPAMELTTEEEAHILCLFPTLEAAESFGTVVYEKLGDTLNKPEFFGEQYIMDENDNVVGTEPKMLIGATSIGVYDAAALADSFGGIAIPAHIDRSSFSVLSNLGFLDVDMGFGTVEITDKADIEKMLLLNPELMGLAYIVDSDAHALDAIPDALHEIEVSERTAEAVINSLKNGNTGHKMQVGIL